MNFDDLDLEDFDKEALSNLDLEALHIYVSKKLLNARKEIAGMSRYSVFISGEQGSYDIEHMIDRASDEAIELEGHLQSIEEILQNRALTEK